MNIITKASNNRVIFTLTERTTLSPVYYLMRMQSRSGHNVKRFILASDLSSYPARANEFIITESTSEVLTSGTVSLSPVGFWDYSIYEQSSSSNLHEDSATNTEPIETGLILVRAQNAVPNTYYTGDSPINTFYGQ